MTQLKLQGLEPPLEASFFSWWRWFQSIKPVGRWANSRSNPMKYQWEWLRILKWRYVSTIFLAILGIFSYIGRKNRPKKLALYMVGTSNQSVPESFPLINQCFIGIPMVPLPFSCRIYRPRKRRKPMKFHQITCWSYMKKPIKSRSNPLNHIKSPRKVFSITWLMMKNGT